MSESTKFDLSTSEGGRGYLESLFQTQLKRQDFTNYIRVELAADFACALSQYIAPALAREAALREELAALHEELSEEFAGEERTPETLQEAIAWLKTARDDNKSRWLSATERLKLQGITIRAGADREAALRRHLRDAATSLETISTQAGRDEFMKDTSDVRGYANSRALAAHTFLDRTAEPEGLTAKHQGELAGFLHKHFREAQDIQQGAISWAEESLFCIPVYLGGSVQAVEAESERAHEIPGTSFQRINQLANEGE